MARARCNPLVLALALGGMAAAPAALSGETATLVAQAPPPARAVDADYYRRRAEREEADKRQARKYYLSLSPFSVAPENATPYQDVVVKAGVGIQGLQPGMCPDPAGVTMARQGPVFRVSYPLVPCENPLAFSAPLVEVKLGRLEPGSYTVEFDVPNDLGLNPVKTQQLTIRPVATDDEALMIAVTESADDVAQWLARRKFSQDRLDTALNRACGSQGTRNFDDPATVQTLLRAGAQPNSAIHQAAQFAPKCMAVLIAAKADVNVDIANVPGSLLSYTPDPDIPRFKVGFEGPPLLFAVRSRNIETARLLLDAGADPNRSFGIGRSPYAESFSPQMGNDEKVRALRQLMEAKGGSRTLAQRAFAGAQWTEGAVKTGGFITACLLSVLFGGKCH